MQPYFLQDETGKRYPPKPAIARKLLKQGHGVWLMKRSVKLYWYGSEPIPKIQLEHPVEAALVVQVLTKPHCPRQSEATIPVQSMPMEADMCANELAAFA